MTPKERALEKRRRIEQAIFPLIGDSRFISFMDEIREQLDAAMEDAVTDRVLANERMLSVALGEIRCYKSILSVYENFKHQAENQEESAAASE